MMILGVLGRGKAFVNAIKSVGHYVRPLCVHYNMSKYLGSFSGLTIGL